VVKIDHIGIAVNSLRQAVSLYAAVLGENPAGEETVPDEHVRVAFFGSGAGRIELLEPTHPESAVARFIENRGPGIHHLCITVPDLDEALERAREAGLELVPPGARRGAGGNPVAFLHPRSSGGVLIELSEQDVEEGLTEAAKR
jgi:methylmalonyl-CoA/ethylmalonyl-CoA epimerase